MYSTCISCGTNLGSNESLEQFPVGRRLAFDASKGRLWVVCRRCRTWNLAPIEERWAAVEAAERLFESAFVGASTENVSLGHLPEGLDLVRVGRAFRPEFSFWRYGDKLLGRWRRTHRKGMVGGVLGFATINFLGGGFPGALAFGAVGAGYYLIRGQRPVLRTESGDLVRLLYGHEARLRPSSEPEGWHLEIPRWRADPIILKGSDALISLRRLLPYMNPGGGKSDQIYNAVREVEHLGSSSAVMRQSAVELLNMDNMQGWSKPIRAQPGLIHTGHPVIQLALEMAANEETERRALDGEMLLLEREWREAEEIAAIADNLLLPQSVKNRLRGWKNT